MSRLLVTTWLFLVLSPTVAYAGEAVLFACASGDLHFTVESAPMLEATKPEGGACARLTHKNGAVLTVAVTPKETPVPAPTPGVEHRLGDPIALQAQVVEVHKYFGADSFTSVAQVKSDGPVVRFQLVAPTRAAHDEVYQELRRFIRTYRPLKAAAPAH